MNTPSRRHRPIYLWHPRIHSVIRNEKLIYALAAFDPVYKRDRVVPEVKQALGDMGIRSYSLWELIGDHDMMIQAWVPVALSLTDFQTKIDEFTSVDVDIMPMVVDNFIDHWMWEDIDLAKAEADISSEDYSDLNEGVVPWTRIKRYLDSGYIHAVPSTSKLKFFVRVTNPNRPIKNHLEHLIRDNAARLFAQPHFSNGVVMKVSGFASYLITGRLLSSAFPAIGTEFQPTFADSGVLEALRCRTVTHLSALHGTIARAEQLLPLAAPDVTLEPSGEDLKSWLIEGESDYLEFKASAFTDIDHKVGRKSNPRNRSEQVHEIARAVVGMLNAAGGTVIIGVAELDKYTAEQLRGPYPGAVEAREHVIIGVDAEFPRGGWDAYQRALARDLRKAIDGEAIDGWVKYQHLEYEGRSICIIRVRRPPTFYYVINKDKNGSATAEFFGRMGGETRRLIGRQMDEFKEAHPRITRGN